MNSTVLKEIIAFLFGRKYYANIINTRGIRQGKRHLQEGRSDFWKYGL